MLLLIIPIIIQVLLIIHVIKTGRNQLWIWVLAFLPLAGRTARGRKKAMDPGADLRRLESETKVAGNVANRQRYAEELARHGRYEDAIAQYRDALTGLYEHDPNLMLGLAQAQFGKGDAKAARGTLDELIRVNPEFRSPAGHLLYARALEAEGEVARALEEYRALAPSYPGAEASVRYAQLLQAQGQ